MPIHFLLCQSTVKNGTYSFFSCNILFVLMAICYKEMTSIPAKYIVVLHVTHRTDSCGIVWCAICIMVHNYNSTIHTVEKLVMLLTFKAFCECCPVTDVCCHKLLLIMVSCYSKINVHIFKPCIQKQ